MNATFGVFLLFSVLVTGLLINPTHIVFADEMQGNSTNTNSTSKTLDESIQTGDVMDKPGDEMMEPDVPTMILSPLKQIKDGVMSKDVVCKDGLELAFKLNGQAACVKATSVEKLITRGWTQ